MCVCVYVFVSVGTEKPMNVAHRYDLQGYLIGQNGGEGGGGKGEGEIEMGSELKLRRTLKLVSVPLNNMSQVQGFNYFEKFLSFFFLNIFAWMIVVY